jgi:hypothetical protein
MEQSSDVEQIPDEAVVLRGGRNRPEDLRRGTGTHPSGVTGVSVECAVRFFPGGPGLDRPAPPGWGDDRESGSRGGRQRQQVELREGLPLTLYSDDGDDRGQSDELLVDGIATYPAEERSSVALIDWDAIHHASDVRGDRTNGAAGPAADEASKSNRV